MSRPFAPPALLATLLLAAWALTVSGCLADAPPGAGLRAVVVLPEDPPLRLGRGADGSLPEVRLPVAEETWLRLAVRQRGLDVGVALVAPDGGVMLEVDSPTGGRGTEPLAFLADQGGEYRLRLEPFSGDGVVWVEVVERRPARAGDRRRFEAFQRWAAGVGLWLADDAEGAQRELRAALRGFQAVGGDSVQTDGRRWLAAALAEMGRIREAAELYERAAEGYRAAGAAWDEAQVRTVLAPLLRRLGRPEAAERSLLRALALLDGERDRGDRSRALHNLGVLRREEGRLAAAESAFRDALDLRRAIGEPCPVVSTEVELGSLLLLVGRDREAADLVEAALPRADGCGAATRVSLLLSLAWTEFLAGEPARALEPLNRAVTRSRESGDADLEIGALDRRGTVLVELDRLAPARRDYLRALTLARRTGNWAARGHQTGNLGRLARRAGELLEARRWLREAIPLLQASGDREGEAYTRLELARVERAAGSVVPALDQLEHAVELVEGVRSGVEGVLGRSYFLSHRRDVYDELVDLRMALHQRESGAGHDHRALEVAGRVRARALLDAVAAGPVGRLGSVGDNGFLETLQRLEAERARRLRAGAGPGEIGSLDRRIRWAALEAERPLASVDEGEQPLDTDGMVSLLDGETQLLVYYLAPEASHLWLLRASGEVRSFRLAGRKRLEELVRAVRREVRAVAAPARGRAARTALGEELFAAAAPHLDRRRLVVVPDGALAALPFGVLAWPPDGKPLLDRFDLSLLPSPAMLALQRRRRGGDTKRGGALVFADPVFGADDARVRGRADGTASAAGAVTLPADLTRAAGDLGLERLDRLGHTAREAAAIRSLRAPLEFTVATGFAASRERLQQASGSHHRVLHFATHALLHPVHPQLSGIVLSLVDEAGLPVDGFARAWEIAGMELPAELVVLSACSTGLGEEIPGEGVVGLPHAFFRAGARRVVVSHWPVDDRATAALMTHFYRGVFEDGLSPPAALGRAQRRVRSDPRWSAPFFWAGFSLLGEWEELAPGSTPTAGSATPGHEMMAAH